MKEQLFKATLQKNNLHVTAERLVIFRILESKDAPSSVSEIVDITKKTLDRSTVYRNLDLFEKVGVTKRVYSGSKHQVELSDIFKPHHHHMTCNNCGQIIPFKESPALDFQLKKLEKLQNFQASSHSLEFKGLCNSCC